MTKIKATKLQEILTEYYGIENRSLEFLREGGTHTYIVNGKPKHLLKVIGSAFSKTARQSVSIMRYLEENGFPVPAIILTKSGDAIFETEDEGEKKLIVLMEFIDGDEPELEKCASEVGGLVGRFHQLVRLKSFYVPCCIKQDKARLYIFAFFQCG